MPMTYVHIFCPHFTLIPFVSSSSYAPSSPPLPPNHTPTPFLSTSPMPVFSSSIPHMHSLLLSSTTPMPSSSSSISRPMHTPFSPSMQTSLAFPLYIVSPPTTQSPFLSLRFCSLPFCSPSRSHTFLPFSAVTWTCPCTSFVHFHIGHSLSPLVFIFVVGNVV